MIINKNNIPDVLYIETTNTCNANCIFCAYQYDKRPKTIIDFNLFKKVVLHYKQAGGRKISLSPFAGEVFTDKNILEKINFLKKQDFDLVYTYTNALLLHKFNINDILNAGLTSINISLGTLDEQTYQKIFRNKNYSQLLKNITSLLNNFNKSSEKTLQHIYLEFRSNISLEKMTKLPDYKKHILPFLNKNITVGVMRTFDSWMGQIEEGDLLDGMFLKSPDFEKPSPCSRLSMLQVLANGDVRVCGCRYNNKAVRDVFHIGNAYKDDIIKLYNNDSVLQLKKSFFEKNIPEECKLCSWYTKDNKWVNTQ